MDLLNSRSFRVVQSRIPRAGRGILGKTTLWTGKAPQNPAQETASRPFPARSPPSEPRAVPLDQPGSASADPWRSSPRSRGKRGRLAPAGIRRWRHAGRARARPLALDEGGLRKARAWVLRRGVHHVDGPACRIGSMSFAVEGPGRRWQLSGPEEFDGYGRWGTGKGKEVKNSGRGSGDARAREGAWTAGR
jgi:hypothetical protein